MLLHHHYSAAVLNPALSIHVLVASIRDVSCYGGCKLSLGDSKSSLAVHTSLQQSEIL